MRGGAETPPGRCDVAGTRLPDTGTRADRAREFWRRALLGGALTEIPRWSRDPVAGVDECEVRIPGNLVAALRSLADDLGVSFGSVLLTAHAKVLGALSGLGEVTTGYVAIKGGSPLLCWVTTEPRSWRAMLSKAHRVESELRLHEIGRASCRERVEIGVGAGSVNRQ